MGVEQVFTDYFHAKNMIYGKTTIRKKEKELPLIGGFTNSG
jgi:hypothetical protein